MYLDTFRKYLEQVCCTLHLRSHKCKWPPGPLLRVSKSILLRRINAKRGKQLTNEYSLYIHSSGNTFVRITWHFSSTELSSIAECLEKPLCPSGKFAENPLGSNRILCTSDQHPKEGQTRSKAWRRDTFYLGRIRIHQPGYLLATLSCHWLTMALTPLQCSTKNK